MSEEYQGLVEMFRDIVYMDLLPIVLVTEKN